MPCEKEPVASGFSLFTDALTSNGTRIRLAAGQTLFSRGQRDTRFFLIESGSVEIGIGSAEGQRLTLNVLHRGDVFGEVAMLDGGPRTADAVARDECTLACLDANGFFSLFQSRLEAYELIVPLLCARIRWINQHTEHGRLSTAGSVLASRLLMIEDAGSSGWIEVSQEELAESAGLTREYVNRLLREWKAAGIVETRRGGVRVCSRSTMQNLCDMQR